MDTLIKGLETPKSCYSETYSEQGNCWFFFYDFKGGCHCSISDCKCLKTKRPKGCPLKELQPHGDLKDESYILRKIAEQYDYSTGEISDTAQDIESIILSAPTILEASI